MSISKNVKSSDYQKFKQLFDKGMKAGLGYKLKQGNSKRESVKIAKDKT